MNLEQIRDRIERDFFGKLLPDELFETLTSIEDFEKEFHYLPEDVNEWYESYSDDYAEYKQMLEEAQCEYDAWYWDNI